MTTGPTLAERSFRAHREAPRTAAEWFRSEAEAAGLSPERLSQAELCLDELVTNVVRYGGGTAEKPVTFTISLRRAPGVFLLAVEDDGPGFDPQEAPEPVFAATLDEAPIGGRGLFLVSSLADELRYERNDGRNRVTLEFRDDGGG